MKSLIATIVLCCMMFLSAFVNFVFVNRTADAMHETVDALPAIDDPLCVEKISTLCEGWEKKAPIIGLTVGFLTIDKVSEYCETLRSCAEIGDVYGYYSTLTLLKDSIDDVRRLEKFSIENLF